MATKSVTIPAAQVAGFPAGRGTCATVEGKALIVFKGADGSLKVAPNNCTHMNAAFKPDVEDAHLMVCVMHGAKMDPSKMAYTSGPKIMGSMGGKVESGTPLPQLKTTVNADGSATIEVPAGGGCLVA